MACGTPEDLILSGAFDAFFDREGIVFDPNTGKLNTKAPETPVGVEGDFQTAYWVGNALIRNGYRPADSASNLTFINCEAYNRLLLHYPDGKSKECTSIAGLIKELKSFLK